MKGPQNKNKIYSIVIVCFAIVLSVWLLQTKAPSPIASKQINDSVVPYQNNVIKTNDDWKKLITEVSPENQKVVQNLTATNSNVFDDTTVTAQVSRDFLSQYLLAKKGGKTLTQAELDKITTNLITQPEYNNLTPVVYVVGNLHTTQNIDTATVKKYKDEVNFILKTRSTQIKDNPVLITNNSLNSGQSSELSKLSSIITTGNLMKSDLLSVIVPKDAVTVHLELLNTSSRVLADIESMKDVYSDPIKSLSGISQYNVDVIDFQNSLKNLNLYFDQKLGKNPN